MMETIKKRVPIKVGDLVRWRALPTIQSKVVKIEPSVWNNEIVIYSLANGCRFQKNEIRKL